MIVNENTKKEIKERVEGLLEKDNLMLVEFKIFFQKNTCMIRITADYSRGGITIDDCARLNKSISSYLDRERILGDDFSVEVISPGLDRKLRKREDFLRVKGDNIIVWLIEPLENRECWEGKILKINQQAIVLEGRKGIIEIPCKK